MPDPTEPTGDTGGFDIDAGVASIAEGMGWDPQIEEPADEPAEEQAEETPEVQAEAPAETEPAAETEVAPTRAAPKAWAKDYHEHWSKLDPKLQDYLELREKQVLDGIDQYKGEAQYGKAFREAIAPYRQLIQAAGVSEAQAIRNLMDAYNAITSGPEASRRAAYENLGRRVGLTPAQAAAAAAGAENAQAPTDPMVRQLQERLNQIESSLTAREQAALEQARTQAMSEVEAFAADPAHAYFDELADDIATMIRTGADLQTAYDKAVWANPVTRQKEIARIQTESQASLKQAASQEVEIARKAKSANIRGKETRKAPTEPKGTMDDTLRETMNSIRTRAH